MRLFFIGVVSVMILGWSATANAEPFGIADSVVGACEVRKAGQSSWQKLRQGAKLYNNDVVRVGDASLTRLTWPHGTSTFIRANSQLLINCFENDQQKSFSQHFTVFWGAVFFLVKNTAPQEFFGKNNTKVYTPTSVIAIRGTSFEVQVEPKSGLTTVGVVSGTVLVRNIIRNVSSFLKAGFKSSIEMNKDPDEPAPYPDAEIEGLKKWVPSEVITTEMNLQIKKARAAHKAISSGDKDRVVILPFSNASDYSGPWNVQGGLASYVATHVGKNIEDLSVAIAGDATSDPLEIGTKEKARFVVKGTIEEFDIIQRAKITARADQYIEYNTAKVKLRLQLIDMVGDKLVYDNVFVGEVTGNHNERNGWKAIAQLKFGVEEKQFNDTILGKAVGQAVEQYGEHLALYLKGELH